MAKKKAVDPYTRDPETGMATAPLAAGKTQAPGMPAGWYQEGNAIYTPNGQFYAASGPVDPGSAAASVIDKYGSPETQAAVGPVANTPAAPAAPAAAGGTPAATNPAAPAYTGPAPGNFDKNWVDYSMATIASKAPNDIDWDAYGNANPDYVSQWANNSDPGVKAMKDAGISFSDFARFRYANGLGAGGGQPDPNLNNFNIYTLGAKAQAEEKVKTDALAKEAADKQAVIDQAKASRRGAITTGRQKQLARANQLLTSYGLDPAAYQEQLNSYLDSKQAGLQDNTDDPYSTFNPDDLISTITGQETNLRRQTLGNEVNTKFGANYGNKVVSDSFLDSAINDILAEQQGTADTYLQRAADRGILNDTGRTAAANKIAQDRARGQSQLSSLAGGVIDKYQSQGDEVAGKAQQGASGYTLGSNFNIGDYEQQGTGIVESANKNARGDLLNALGGQNFFDTSSLVNIGGQAQGATGLVDNTLAAAVAERKKRDSVSRGLGSQGAF